MVDREPNIKRNIQTKKLEEGGILLGYWQGDQLVITDTVRIANPSARKNKYILAATELNKYLTRRDFVGLFHTHRISSCPGLSDLFTMYRLCRRTKQTIVLGIRQKRLKLWKFEPGKLLPVSIHVET